jgi:hypothetical protein
MQMGILSFKPFSYVFFVPVHTTPSQLAAQQARATKVNKPCCKPSTTQTVALMQPVPTQKEILVAQLQYVLFGKYITKNSGC